MKKHNSSYCKHESFLYRLNTYRRTTKTRANLAYLNPPPNNATLESDKNLRSVVSNKSVRDSRTDGYRDE